MVKEAFDGSASGEMRDESVLVLLRDGHLLELGLQLGDGDGLEQLPEGVQEADQPVVTWIVLVVPAFVFVQWRDPVVTELSGRVESVDFVFADFGELVWYCFKCQLE